MVSWRLRAKFPLFFVRSFKGRETLFSPSMVWVLEGVASSEVASATGSQIVNPLAMQKCSHPDRCWIWKAHQCSPSTSQYLFPNDHRALLCSAETWDPYNIYHGKWEALALWSARLPRGLCSCCCAALLRDGRLSQPAELMSRQSCCYPCPARGF